MSFVLNNTAGVRGRRACARPLISHGHRRIAIIAGEPWMDAAKDRLRGSRRALATADIPFDAALVIEGDWSASSVTRPPCASWLLRNVCVVVAIQARALWNDAWGTLAPECGLD